MAKPTEIELKTEQSFMRNALISLRLGKIEDGEFDYPYLDVEVCSPDKENAAYGKGCYCARLTKVYNEQVYYAVVWFLDMNGDRPFEIDTSGTADVADTVERIRSILTEHGAF